METKTVLIIDDEESFARLLKWNLEATTAYRGLVATSGHAALELVKARQPDVVLLDLSMPGLDGLQTLRQLRALAPELPVAMVTAVWNAAEARKCFETGAYDYITKPIDFEYLKNVLLVKLLS